MLIAFFNIRNSNHKHTCVEHIPNINFVFYPVKSDALPILQKCPILSVENSHAWLKITKIAGKVIAQKLWVNWISFSSSHHCQKYLDQSFDQRNSFLSTEFIALHQIKSTYGSLNVAEVIPPWPWKAGCMGAK